MASKISRYVTPQGPEAEFQPGSYGRVLRNQLGIRSKPEMDRVEYEALRHVQEEYFMKITPVTRFTAALICQMHRDWLGEIYAWAGQYRSVELQKDGFSWPPAFRVPENMSTFEVDRLARLTPCRPNPLPQVAQQIAEVHAELLFIHPFREGNGRLARWVADLMSLQAGFPVPKYVFSGPDEEKHHAKYLTAVKSGYLQNYDLLTEFFAEAITRALAAAGRGVTGGKFRAPSK